MDSPVITAAGLTRRFKRRSAVDRLDLVVQRGEVFGLIGPDGAGKTTTIRLLAALMQPTSGTARVLEYDTRRDAELVRRSVGYMPQKFSLYGDLTVAENLAFFADIFAVRGRERNERIERLLSFARLAEFTGRRAAALSGGMQKKLALACTLVHAPPVIFLDEPTTGVDPISRREFWDILADLHAQGVTLFISTPYMDEAERCSRVGLMYNGRLIECAAPAVLRSAVQGELLAVSTPRVIAARDALSQANLPEIIELQVYGDLLHVFVKDARTADAPVRRALQAAQVPVMDIHRAQPRVEEAFISLIRRQVEFPDGRGRDSD
ncbi:MAG: ABC transporter ATP-binding protein [Nitrososphaerales archaeon]